MSQISNDHFLNKFIEINEFPSSDFFIKNEIIIVNDTIESTIVANKFLIPINTIKHSNAYLENKYYYYGKYKLNDNYYVISCKVFFNHHESRILSFIYSTEKKAIISSIEIMLNDFNIKKASYFKDNILVIESTYNKIQNGLDPPKGKEFLKKIEIEKYEIDGDFRFVKLK